MRSGHSHGASVLRSRAVALRDRLVERQVAAAVLPDFSPEKPIRCRMAFSGRVQGVGFRQEAALMARRLGLTGWVCNLPDGQVLLEAQGAPARIRFLVAFLRSLWRISVKTIRWCLLPPVEGEGAFQEFR